MVARTGTARVEGNFRSPGRRALADKALDWMRRHRVLRGDEPLLVFRTPGAVRRHAEPAGFPANSISRVHVEIDPTTAA